MARIQLGRMQCQKNATVHPRTVRSARDKSALGVSRRARIYAQSGERVAERFRRHHGPLGDGPHAAIFCSVPPQPRQTPTSLRLIGPIFRLTVFPPSGVRESLQTLTPSHYNNPAWLQVCCKFAEMARIQLGRTQCQKKATVHPRTVRSACDKSGKDSPIAERTAETMPAKSIMMM